MYDMGGKIISSPTDWRQSIWNMLWGYANIKTHSAKIGQSVYKLFCFVELGDTFFADSLVHIINCVNSVSAEYACRLIFL